MQDVLFVQSRNNWRMAASNLTMRMLDAAYFTDRKKAKVLYAKLFCVFTIYTIYLCNCFGLSQSVLLLPLTSQPAVEEVEGSLGLVRGNLVASLVNAQEGETLSILDLSVLLAISAVDTGDGSVVEGGLAGPVESVGPSLVSEPVADPVGITSVDQNGDLSQNTRDLLVDGLHPVTSVLEVLVNTTIAVLETAVELGTEGILDALLAEVLVGVAVDFGSVVTDIIDTAAGALVRAEEGVVAAVKGSAASGSAATVVTSLNLLLAAREGVGHRLASAGAQDGGVTTLTASHWSVVGVLGVGVGKTVADKDTLQVDLASGVGENLRGGAGDVVSGVGFTSNVERLGRVLGVLCKEQAQKGVEVLGGDSAGPNSVSTGVGVTGADGLVDEDDGGVGVPCVWVANRLKVTVGDAGRTKLLEETNEGAAARTAVQPEDDGVGLRVAARLEEPCKGVLAICCLSFAMWYETYRRKDACLACCRQGNR